MSRFALILIYANFMLLFICSARPASSQKISQSIEEIFLSVNLKNSQVEEVLKEISTETGFRFIYDKLSIPNTSLTLAANNESLGNILREISQKTRLEFRRTQDNITIKKNQGTALPVSEAPVVEVVDVSGRVTDENGGGLPGVNVVVKGTGQGTITDVDGNYSLEVSSEDAILVFSSVGYISQEVPLGARSVVDVAMDVDVQSLDEVVVVGYGTEKKRDFVGSIEKIKSAEIAKQNVVSVAEALQGLASGLYIGNNNGYPGSAPDILVRGANSINLSTQPLWIVDGVPIQTGALENTQNGVKSVSPLAMINPNDIESVEVLKDAAATAIYGNRGSNGVIIITTKTNKGGGTNVSINYDGGISSLPFNYNDIVVSSQQWWDLVDQAWANTGSSSTFTPEQIIVSQFLDEQPEMSREQAIATNTDHLEAFTQNSRFHQIGFTGNKGFETGGVMFSLNYRDEKGVLNNNDLKRLTSRFSFNFSPTEAIDVGINTNFLYLKNSGVQSGLSKGAGGWGNFFTAYPWFPIYDASSQTGYWAANSGYNMLASTDENLIRNDVDEYRTISNAFVQWNTPLEGLRVRGEAGVDLIINNSSYWRSVLLDANAPFVNEAAEKSVTKYVLNYNTYLNYEKTLGIHHLSATVGAEAIRQSQYTRSAEGNQIYSRYPELINPLVITNADGYMGGEQYLMGIFGRATYKLNDKYIINASIRRDGHSALSKENRWATFKALGAGWILSDENFFNVPQISLLKLRGSYGITGNTGLSTQMTQLNMGLSNNRYGSGYLPGGTTIGPIGNSSLKWETTANFDVGLDFGLLDDRISGSVAYYTQNVSDLILRGDVPFSTGFTRAQVWENVGDLKNWGWELSVSSVNINKNSFTWGTDFNVSLNNNKIVRLNEFEKGKGSEGTQKIRKEGEKINTWYLSNYTGVDPQRGIVMIEERDQEIWDSEFRTVPTGNIIPGNRTNSNQNKMVQQGKSELPTFYGGLTNRFTYKNFDLNVLMVFAGGHYLYNGFLSQTTRVDGVFTIAQDMIGNAWEKPGDQAKYPQLMYGSNYNYDNEGNPSDNGSRFETNQHSMNLERADYLRIRNLQLGYTLPTNATDKINIGNVRVYVGGTNLLSFTKFEGLDPETNGDLPIPRVINFGVSVNL